MSRIHLNFGSNLGESRAIVEEAVAMVADALGGCSITLSPWIESAPWGFDSPNPFVNLGVMIETDTPAVPEAVHSITRAVEERLGAATPHRQADGSYADRLIDIDIIDIDNRIFSSPDLTLPHPRAHLREFVMEPLRALDPATAAFVALRH